MNRFWLLRPSQIRPLDVYVPLVSNLTYRLTLWQIFETVRFNASPRLRL